MDNIFTNICKIAEQTNLITILIFILLGLIIVCCFAIHENNAKINYLKQQNEEILKELKSNNSTNQYK